MGVKGAPLVLLYVHIGSTSLDLQMGDIWLVSMLELKGSSILKCFSRTSVPDMNKEG